MADTALLPPPRFAFIALLGGNAALAMGPWLVRLADDIGPIAAGFWRLALGLPVLLLLMTARRQKISGIGRIGWILVIVGGVAFAADLASWHLGIVRTKLANAALFGNASTLLLPLWTVAVARQLPTRLQTLALLLAFIGAALMMGRSLELAAVNLTGDLLCILAGIFYTVYLLSVQRVRQNLQSWAALAISTAASVLPMLAFALAMGERIIPGNWTPVLILAMSSQVLGQGLMVYAIAYFSPLVIGLTLLVQPIIAATVGWLAFGERLGVEDVLGMGLVAAALVLIRLPAADGKPNETA